MQQDLVIQTLKSEVQHLHERWGQKDLRKLKQKIEGMRRK